MLVFRASELRALGGILPFSTNCPVVQSVQLSVSYSHRNCALEELSLRCATEIRLIGHAHRLHLCMGVWRVCLSGAVAYGECIQTVIPFGGDLFAVDELSGGGNGAEVAASAAPK